MHLRVGPWFVSDPMWVLGHWVVVETAFPYRETASLHCPLLSVPLRMGCMCVRKRFPFFRKLAPAEGGMYRRCGLFDMALESIDMDWFQLHHLISEGERWYMCYWPDSSCRRHQIRHSVKCPVSIYCCGEGTLESGGLPDRIKHIYLTRWGLMNACSGCSWLSTCRASSNNWAMTSLVGPCSSEQTGVFISWSNIKYLLSTWQSLASRLEYCREYKVR